MALTSKGHFKVNGAEFEAKTLKVNYESLQSDDSGRTADGVLHIHWVFRKVRKVEIELPPCDSLTCSRLFNSIQGKEYDLTYFDPLDSAERTIRVYTSNSSGDLYSGVIFNGLWQGVGFHAIELAGEK